MRAEVGSYKLREKGAGAAGSSRRRALGGAWADTEDQRQLVIENLSFSKSKTERGFGPGVWGGERE